MLSPAQQNALNLQLWPDAAKAQDWPRTEAAARMQGHSSVRAFRLKVLSGIVGHQLGSSSEIESIHEFTRVKDHLLLLAGSLGGRRGAGALPDDNALRTRRWVALRDIQCLLLYVDEAYVRAILKQRFARGGVCPTAFDHLPLHAIVAEFRDVRILDELLSTLNERLHAKGRKHADGTWRRQPGKRVEAGHTVHQMRQLAHVGCDRTCRTCHPVGLRCARPHDVALPSKALPAPPVPEPEPADCPY